MNLKPHAVPTTLNLLLATLIAPGVAFPQTAQQPPAIGAGQITQAQNAVRTAQLATQQASNTDHQDMMDQLHIASLRRGRDGMNKDSPNYAHYDESIANPYPVLPDPLLLKNGKKVKTAADWWNKRRPEIVEDFDREIYGRVPKNAPSVKWEVIKTTEETVGGVAVVTKQIQGVADNSADPQIEVKIALTVTVPKDAKGAVPVIMQFGGFGFGPPPSFAGRGFVGAPAGGPAGRGPAGPTWQQQCLAKGWGYAQLPRTPSRPTTARA